MIHDCLDAHMAYVLIHRRDSFSVGFVFPGECAQVEKRRAHVEQMLNSKLQVKKCVVPRHFGWLLSLPHYQHDYWLRGLLSMGFK